MTVDADMNHREDSQGNSRREQNEHALEHSVSIGPGSPGKSSLLNKMLAEHDVDSRKDSTEGGFKEVVLTLDIPMIPKGRVEKRTNSNGTVYYIWQRLTSH